MRVSAAAARSSLCWRGLVEKGRRFLHVDVHAHLTHQVFHPRHHPDYLREVHKRCEEQQVDFVVLNGLEPESNRHVLSLCEEFDRFLPALGVYPLDAACRVLPNHWVHDFPPPQVFDVEKELDFIELMAQKKKIVAIGECGLDAYYVKAEEVLQEQERVLRRLMTIARDHDLPIILHSRKAEKRVFELLQEEKISKAVFHCFMGKAKLAKRIAAEGYHVSVPPAVVRIETFGHVVRATPLEFLLTETDSPFMSSIKENTNEPSEILIAVREIAKLKGIPETEVAQAIRKNCRRLFRI